MWPSIIISTMQITAYHRVSRNNLEGVLQGGLAYGAQGEHSHEGYAERANAFLDKHIPPRLVEANVSRQKCLYACLALDGKLIDVETGRTTPPREWSVPQGYGVLQLAIDDEQAFISDLDAYDRFSAALEQSVPDGQLTELAAKYWQTVHPLSAVCPYATLAEDGIGLRVSTPDLPNRYRRPEVMIASTVPSSAIRELM